MDRHLFERLTALLFVLTGFVFALPSLFLVLYGLALGWVGLSDGEPLISAAGLAAAGWIGVGYALQPGQWAVLLGRYVARTRLWLASSAYSLVWGLLLLPIAVEVGPLGLIAEVAWFGALTLWPALLAATARPRAQIPVAPV